MPPTVYAREEEKFMGKLRKTDDEIIALEITTRGQNSNPIWKQERSIRLTASNFGRVCKMRKTTSCAKTVESLLYRTFKPTEAMRYGSVNEANALKDFQAETNLLVRGCGLYVGQEHLCYLAASPDGIVTEDAIIEIKCPMKATQYAPIEAARRKLVDFVDYDEERQIIKLKRNHSYMYQVQGQLHITGKSWCYFVIWTPVGIHIEKIERDEDFWKNKMEPQLRIFYKNCLLPEMIDPRFTRPNGMLRNPSRDY